MENSAIVRGTGGKSKPLARCERGQAKPAKKRTRRADGNGFLNRSFLPFWSFSGNRERVAREFFNSLANLCAYYKIAVPQTELPFPQNIFSTWQKVEKQVKELDMDNHCRIVKHKGNAVLSVIKTLDISNCLFYIPVKPYWNWSQRPEEKRITELVTVIFAYLHQVVGIPFYAQSGSFLDYQYDTLEQWVSDTEDEGKDDEEDKLCRQQQEDTLYELKRAGGHIMPVIQNPELLEIMEQVVRGYHHRDDKELAWELLGIEFLQLYLQYPKRSLYDSIATDLIYPDEDERIRVDQYTSFYWSDNDCFQYDLIEMINSSFQEMPVMDEPTTVYYFNEMPDPERTDFGFENRLFALIERLRDLLNLYDNG
jgi:hypothetical protein